MVNQAIVAHFKRTDPILYTLSRSIHVNALRASRPAEYFDSLCRHIIGQQVSGKVAEVIYKRFRKCFPRCRVTASGLAALSDDTLRSAGISRAKIRSVRDLSRRITEKTLVLSSLADATDAEIMETLMKVKGIGPWTAEMFLIFTLGRPDVFSYGDLGLRRAIRKLYGFTAEPSPRAMKRIVEAWRPYRSTASRLLWAYLDADIPGALGFDSPA